MLYDTTFRVHWTIWILISIGSFCLSVCQTARMFYSLAFQILWPEIFFSHSWSIEGKPSCAKRIEIIFRGLCRPRKLKSAKNNPHVFLDKTAKIWRCENTPLYGKSVRAQLIKKRHCAPSKDSDKPAHLCGLISSLGGCHPEQLERIAKTLIRLANMCLCWVILMVLSCFGSNFGFSPLIYFKW